MGTKEPNASVFSFRRTHRRAAAGLRLDGPYAEAWKKFEMMQNAAEGGGIAGLILGLTALAPLVTALVGGPGSRRFELESLLFVAALGGAALVWRQYWASQIKRWRCPRCRQEWPGTNSEKAPQCAACGLNLFQSAS
jgi:hypothetical protein